MKSSSRSFGSLASLAAVMLLSGLRAGCGGSPQAKTCTPGQSVACFGLAACQGGQTCNPDGKSYGPCQCGAAGGANGGAGSGGGRGGSGASGSGGASGSSGVSGSSGASGSSGVSGSSGGRGGSAGVSGVGGMAAGGGAGGQSDAGGAAGSTSTSDGAAGAGTAGASDGGADRPMVYPHCAHAGSGAIDAAPSSLFVLTGRYAHGYGAVADVNGDGFVDLVEFGSFTASVWLGCGDGTFSTSALTSNIPTTPMLWGDFTGDHRLDLIYETPYTNASSGLKATNLNLLVGQPDATFILTINSFGNLVGADHGSNLTSSVLADVNGDGRMDIVFGGYFVSGTSNAGVLYTALGLPADQGGAGLGISEKQYGGFGRFGGLDGVEIADIDCDGHLDALVNYHTTTTTNVTTYGHAVLPGNGDGTFKDPSPVATLSLPLGSYTWGQIDGDGKVDAILSNTSGTQVYWNEGGLTFSAGPQVPSLAFGDFDGDGQADFLVSGSSTGSTAPGMIVFGDGARGFGRALATPAINLAITDVNGDGVSDLLSFDGVSGVLSIYVSTAKQPALGPPDVDCTPLPAAACTGPTGF